MLLETMYTQLKQTLGEDYTAEDVESATYEQAESITRQQVTDLLGTDDFTQTMLANVRKLLIRDAAEENNIAAMLSIEDEIISIFPNAQFERGCIADKRFVTVWLDGKPEEVSI